MVQRPLPHDPRGLLRQATGDDVAGGDSDESLETLIAGMKMGRWMIVMIHPDNNAEEEGDDRHSETLELIRAETPKNVTGFKDHNNRRYEPNP